ncbi:hypothetical protein GTZ99_03160 [Novosphingobium sp. FSY-8]|uniref:Tail completion protein R (GpR) n=1 Tax=Novosphingobium ovatum TaxID=1908523 RepID=A0ABW9XAJ6_9SPHN|nr:phage tail protein [Novosphingobium ovatum]NBC35551.1 hypothetical protein [Novosphingobium ovatum]
MNKINALRASLTQAMPELAASPKNLRMWVDRGTVGSRHTATLGFGFKYRLNVLLVDFASDIAALVLPIWIWARLHQPDLLEPKTDGLSFDVDFMSATQADILIQMDLTENVTATAQDGGYRLTYLPEPTPMFADDLPPGGLEAVPLLSAIRFDP